jgi:hypothetical protein
VAVKAGDRTGRIICMLVADCKQTSSWLLTRLGLFINVVPGSVLN